MSETILIYGSYGYTGELVVEQALKQGLRPLLGGRDAARVAAQAKRCGLPHRAFGLDDPDAVDRGLDGIAAVLNCAGPFVRTAAPMVEGCLRQGVHYLDITGEIPVFEDLAAREPEARGAGIMLLPGAGFDVVPTDCLAAHLASGLPDASSLSLAFQGLGQVSRGTATTAVENLSEGGAIRRDGLITPVPTAYKTREIDFGDGPVSTVTIPWGDVSTAWFSTGIPNIEVFTAMPPRMIQRLRRLRHFGWLIGLSPVQALIKRRIRRGPPGPDAATRDASPSRLWGEARNPAGQTVAARMRTPNGYTLTALTAVEAARRSVSGGATPGFQTPSRAFGKDFVLEFDGCEREDP